MFIYNSGPKWSKNILTYKIENFTPDLTQADTS